MIKVLIVDDDKLARMGFMAVMPWGKYDMEVCGEAPSGMEALEFLRRHHVDLMFIDLEMPGMFGLELLKRIRELRPAIKCVILTMHQEFNYIQEALRLDVLDYVIKTELSEENFDEVLGRISRRISGMQGEIPVLSQNDSGYSDEIRQCVLKAVRLIEEKNGEHISATEAAKRVNMSRSYFSTCFKQIMRMSFNDYFRTNRMQLAEELLITTKKSVSWIALETGFTNEKYFATVFKSYSGQTPSEYRSANKQSAS